jgi:hypothetical protein
MAVILHHSLVIQYTSKRIPENSEKYGIVCYQQINFN